MSHKIIYSGEEKIIRRKWTIGIICFDILIFGIILLIMVFLLKKYPQTDNSKFTGIFTFISLLLILPTILGRDLIIERFASYYKKERLEVQSEKKILNIKNLEESNALRERLNLPDYILTQYEYSNIIHKKEIPTKLRIAVMIIFEVLCLGMTCGMVFYGDLLSAKIAVITATMGIIFGIYGFCFLCGAYFKGIIYSIYPILCFAIPLLIAYISGIRTGWLLVLISIVGGFALAGLSLAYFVIIPKKRKDNLEQEYLESFLEDKKDLENQKFFFENIGFFENLYNLDGRSISIFQKNNSLQYYLYKIDKIIFKGIELKDRLVGILKVSSLEEAEKNAIEFLKN